VAESSTEETRVTRIRAVAIDLDGALGDTHILWSDWLASAASVLGIDTSALPADRGEAATELDRCGAGNWRTLLERFSEDRAPVYLRRDSPTSSALRELAGSGRPVGIFTDAPEGLARVALTQLGGQGRISALETGSGALERLLVTLGADAVVIRTRAELLELGSG
jgi:phosphoglycolate phosphatase-like HAD superfamily hydrolase